MADGTNQNDQVKDLLARLRSQMSQLDEAFGLVDGKEQPTPSPVAVPEKEENTLTEAVEEDVSIAEAEPEKEADGEDAVTALEADEGEKLLPLAEVLEIDVAQPTSFPDAKEENDLPSQLDFFAALAEEPLTEDALPERAEESEAFPEVQETLLADESENEGEDELVFANVDAPTFVHKESIVAAAPTAADEEAAPLPIVVEVDRNEAEIREKTQTHTSLFVPDAPQAEETVSTGARSPFSAERHFDPSRYDAVLLAYRQQKNDAEEEAATPPTTEEKPPVVLPQSILFPMPTVSEITLPTPPSVSEDDAQELAELREEQPEEADALTPEVIEDVQLLTIPSTEAESQDEAEAATAVQAEAEDEGLTENDTLEAVQPEVVVEEDIPPMPKPRTKEKQNARVRLAEVDLSDNDRSLRMGDFRGRVHLAPSAYRAKSENITSRTVDIAITGEEEDYMDGLPAGLRSSLANYPLGRPNRAQGARTEQECASGGAKAKKKRRRYLFPEECNDGSEALDVSGGYLKHQLKEDIYQTRGRLIIIAVLAFILLLLENITKLPDLVPSSFVDGKTAGVIDLLLLLGVTCAAWPRLRIGFLGLFRGRILTESVLALQVVAAGIYAAIFGALEMPVLYFSFVPALGLALLYSFRVLDKERQLRELRVTKSSGEKLTFSPTERKDMGAELRALNAEKGRTPLVYRLCKTEFVGGFFRRNATICEDERLNLWLLLSMPLVGIGCFLISLVLGNNSWHVALQSAVFGAFLTAPLLMCGAHVFPMYRTGCVVGEDSAIVGEATVRECVSAAAVAFEDTEGMASEGVSLSGIQVHCNDPATVFKYLTALYGHIGGPLRGSFSGIYVGQSNDGALVELVDATSDGICAVIDGAEIVVGNGRHMVKKHILAQVEEREETMLPSGRSGVLYVAINGMVCMKFYMEHHISPAFAKNALRLHRLGLATILRTYDPNFNDKTLSRNAALGECRVHVVSKRADQLDDICVERTDSGIVTRGGSHKLLRLLLLCFRTDRALRFGWLYKLVFAIVGGGAALLSAFLGLYAFVPSVYLALYHLVTLFGFMVFTTVYIRLPDASEKK